MSNGCHVSSNLYVVQSLGRLLWDFKFKYSHIHLVWEITVIKQIVSSFFFFPSTTQPSESNSMHSRFFLFPFPPCWRREAAALPVQTVHGVWVALLNLSSESNFLQLKIRIKFQL